ncbi:MAG: AzlD domain-containing protein [Methyloligellaceae bacterium]
MGEQAGLALGTGIWPYLFLLTVGFCATEPWRWLGLVLARRLDIESEILKWVKAVSTALVAGLVARMILFPAGALLDVPLWLRLAAFAVGIMGFFIFRQMMIVGVALGAGALLLGQVVL